MPPHRHAYRPDRDGHPRRRRLRASAGLDGRHPMLLAGGNAVDAAVAVGSTLNVVEPFMSGIGGIGLMLVSRPDGERHVLDFIGRRPARGRRRALHRGRAGRRAQGVRDAGQPGRLAGRARALRPVPRAARLEPAIGHAERGVPLTFKNVGFFTGARETLKRSREAERLYWPNGGPRAGAVMAYKDLAATFRQVAEGGLDVVLPWSDRQDDRARGTGGRRVARRGGPGRFAPEWREPARITLSRLEDRLDAAAVLGLPDARDAEHPGGLRSPRLGPQLRRLSPPPHRGDQARLGRPARLRLRRRDARSPACCPRPTPPRSARASTRRGRR